MREGRTYSRRRFYALRAGVLAAVVAGTMAGWMSGPLHAEGVTAVAPPAMYPATTWQGRGSAVLRIMRRLDSHVEHVPLRVGEEVQYGALSLKLERCLQKPAGLPAESAALLHIDEKQDDGSPAFEGWMFTDDPALGAYAGALYDVQVISCEGEAVAPMAGPLPSPVTPHLPGIMAPHVEADDGHAASPLSPSPGNAGQGNNGQMGGVQGDAGQAGSGGPLSLLPPAAPAPPPSAPAPQAGDAGQR